MLTYHSGSGAEAQVVTASAHKYLFEPLVLEGAVTVADVFALLSTSQVLLDIYSRWHYQDYHKAVQSEPKPDDPAAPPSEKLECVELRRIWWELELGQERVLSSVDFVGLSVRQTELHPSYGIASGERITFGLAGSDLRTLLQLPLRIADTESPVGWNSSKVLGNPLTLGEALEGLLRELSFFGPQDEIEQLAQLIENQTWSEPMSGEEFIEGLNEMFSTQKKQPDDSPS